MRSAERPAVLVTERASSGIVLTRVSRSDTWYENALALELRAVGLSVVQQCGAKVYYKDTVVGEYFVDLLVEDVLLIELKTVRALDDSHRMQCTNYLKATGRHLCLLLNFDKSRLEINRVAHDL